MITPWQVQQPALLLAAVLFAAPAAAQIVLSESEFEAGSRFAAFFKVERGCGSSPTVALEVQIPAGVTVLQLPDKPGWTLRATHTGAAGKQRVAAVTWRGRLEAAAQDQFGLLLQLPDRPGALYFPVVQRCESGETRWTEIPGEGQAARKMPHPATVLKLTPSRAPVHDHH